MLYWFQLNHPIPKQKLKDLSSTYLTSSERRLLDLESEVMRGPDSIPTGGSILSLDFLFSRSKDKNANIGIFVVFVKNSITIRLFENLAVSIVMA